MVGIRVLDINDNDPVLLNLPMNITLSENTPVSSFVTRILARDADKGPNALLTFDITSGNTENAFYINSTVWPWGLRPSCTGGWDTGTWRVNTPVPESYLLWAPMGATWRAAFSLPTLAGDAPGEARLTSLAPIFSLISHQSGIIYLNRPLDRERVAEYRLTVTVKDNPENIRNARRVITDPARASSSAGSREGGRRGSCHGQNQVVLSPTAFPIGPSSPKSVWGPQGWGCNHQRTGPVGFRASPTPQVDSSHRRWENVALECWTTTMTLEHPLALPRSPTHHPLGCRLGRDIQPRGEGPCRPCRVVQGSQHHGCTGLQL